MYDPSLTILKLSTLSGTALVVAISAWLSWRHPQPFFVKWTRAYAAMWAAALLDVVDVLTGWHGPVLIIATAALVASCHLELQAAAELRGRPPPLWVSRLVFALGLFPIIYFAGWGSHQAAVAGPVIAQAAATVWLGATVLRRGSSLHGASHWLGLPVVLKGLWIFSYPLVARASLAPIGYSIDGLLHVLTGLGMVVLLLERNAAELRLLIDESIDQAFFMLGRRGEITRWNSGAERMFGLRADAAVGAPLSTVFAPDAGRPELALDGRDQQVAIRLRRGDGTGFWAELGVSPITGSTEHAHAFAVTVRDVSEKHAIQQERLRLAAAVEQSAESVLIADAEGLVRYVNPAFQLNTGFGAEVIGQPLDTVALARPDAAASDPIAAAMRSRTPWRGHVAGRTRDGRDTTEDASVSPIRDGAGAVTGFLLTRRDITRELALQAQLRHAQKMEDFGRLAAGVAHDFGNLTAIIAAYNNLLQTEPLGRDVVDRSCGAIARATDRASRLIRQLLAYARRDAAAPRSVDVNAVLSQLATMLERIIGNRIHVLVELDPELPRVRIDPAQLEHVVMNLATNARDAMPEGGTLRLVTARRAGGSAGSPLGEVEVTVADTGMGMSPETIERAFEPFFTTKPTRDGTGLGLSIAHEIVREAGGSIEVESAVGAGTTFRVVLPACEAQEGAPAAGPRDAPAATLLVVEDDPAVRESLTLRLGTAGFCVLAAGDAEAALRVAEQQPSIDVLVAGNSVSDADRRIVTQHLLIRHPRMGVLPLAEDASGAGEVAVRVRALLSGADSRPARAASGPGAGTARLAS